MTTALLNIAAAFSAALVGEVLLFAGIMKVGRPRQLRSVLAGYSLLPESLVGTAAALLPITEAAVGVSLLLGIGRPVAGRLAAMLLIVFSVAVAINLLRGRASISCGCFGMGESTGLTWWHVSRNVALAAAAICASSPAIALPEPPRPRVFDYLPMLLAAAVVLTTARLLHVLRRLQRPIEA
jgi:hypothetical protein